MGNHNSLDFYKSLTMRLHRDIAERHSLSDSSKEFKRNVREIERRFSSEGVSFLTKTLPALGKRLDKALQGSKLVTPGFAKTKGAEYPSFLGFLFRSVFDDAGYVRTSWSGKVEAVRSLRQLAYFTYKLELPYDEETEKSVLESFVQTEEALANHQWSPYACNVVNEAAQLVASVINSDSALDFTPKHGPGAVATGERGAFKSTFTRSYLATRLMFPFGEYFASKLDPAANGPMPVLATSTAKVVPVAKDSRGPRLISCEPLETQWLQQGIKEYLVPLLETHPLTGGQVNFTCQDINRDLARIGSNFDPTGRVGNNTGIWRVDQTTLHNAYPKRHRKYRKVSTGDWVTIDMKDASDRVSLRLVEKLFEGTFLLNRLIATRSTQTLLPDGRLVKLCKFAPMGSAVCFPVEALAFFALAVAGLMHDGRYTRWARACENVFVYGDDIIVRREDYPPVKAALESVGLTLNEDKCCVSGFFRESCGLDACEGVDVTPIRCRKTWDHHGVKSAEELVSWVSLSNSLGASGYWRAAAYIARAVTEKYGHLPEVPYAISAERDLPTPARPEQTSRVIGWFIGAASSDIPALPEGTYRYNRKLHRQETYGYIVEPVYQVYQHRGVAEYFRHLVAGSKRANVDAYFAALMERRVHSPAPALNSGKQVCGRYPVPHRSRLKRGWGAR
jgi:hypothetical protein